MHADLAEAIDFHHAIIAEGGKALVGYDTAKALANIVLLSEIPTTYDKREQRLVNAGNLLYNGSRSTIRNKKKLKTTTANSVSSAPIIFFIT